MAARDDEALVDHDYVKLAGTPRLFPPRQQYVRFRGAREAYVPAATPPMLSYILVVYMPRPATPVTIRYTTR